MPFFDYVILDQSGKEKKGKMEANDVETVRSQLKAQGLIPIAVTEETLLNKEITFGGGVKPRDLSLFCKQFHSVLAAGVTVINALQMLSEQTEKKSMRKAIRDVQLAVEKGETLASGMGGQPQIFPPMLINMVEAGEASGNLDTAFERMATQFEKDAKLRSVVIRAMVYPIIVCVVAVAVVILMLTFVVPQFMSMFDDADIKLPKITLAVIAVSDFMVKFWWLMLLIIAGIVIGLHFYKASDTGRMTLSRIGLRIPLFGKLIVKSSAARFTRTLSTLLAAGISLIDAVEITAKIMDNQVIKDALIEAKEEVERGVPLSEPLEISGLFPPMLYHMVKIGEETGNMEAMLDKVADFFEDDVEQTTQVLTTVLEPLIIVVLAVVVGGIIMSVLAPMFTLYSSVDKM